MKQFPTCVLGSRLGMPISELARSSFRGALLWSLVFVLLSALAGCLQEGKTGARYIAGDAEATRRAIIGERLYRQYCAGCHGETGEGDGMHSFTLNPPPANHADSSFMSGLSDEYLLKVISSGGASVQKSREMPGWKYVVNEKEIQNIIIYMRTLSTRSLPSEE